MQVILIVQKIIDFLVINLDLSQKLFKEFFMKNKIFPIKALNSKHCTNDDLREFNYF